MCGVWDSRATNVLRSIWGHNDFTVCKIISLLAKARMQIFTYVIQTEHKDRMKGRVIRFVQEIIKHSTFKALIRQIKTGVPKLLGYGDVEVFLHDSVKNNLYCMSVNEEQQPQYADLPHSFEMDYIVDEKQIVRFPPSMGISGYALRGDAVCFINEFAHKQATLIGPLRASTSSSRQQVLSLVQ